MVLLKSLRNLNLTHQNNWKKDLSGDDESLGIIKNFNKDASVVNQFFPTMLKTKISNW